MKRGFCSIVLAGLLAMLPGGPQAAGGDDADTRATPPKDPALAALVEAEARKDWAAAAQLMKAAIARAPAVAEYHNRYAYALRKGASPDMKLVFHHYREALRLEPKHRGAHEYIGEAYLMVGDLPGAKRHLAELDRLCFFGCDEYDELKKAIAAREKAAQAKQGK